LIFYFQASHAIVAQVACDSLLLLCDKADVLLELYPNVPSKIIQVCNIIKFNIKMNVYGTFVQYLDFVGHAWTNDDTRKARIFDGNDAVLFR